MEARFFVTAPKQVRITLQLTDTAEIWGKIADHLAQASPGEPALGLAQQIRLAVRAAEKPLYSEQWATPYATGISEPEKEVEK